jgi:hypothetical protein
LTWRHSTIDSLAPLPHPEHTGTVGTLIVSKSLFLLLFSVALLAAAASFPAGGDQLGEIGTAASIELHADVSSLADDMRDLRLSTLTAPVELRALWTDAWNDVNVIADDAVARVKAAARRLATLINTR